MPYLCPPTKNITKEEILLRWNKYNVYVMVDYELSDVVLIYDYRAWYQYHWLHLPKLLYPGYELY